MSTRETYKLELEQLLDGGHSVPDILDMLAEVCFEKADWVTSPESIGNPDHVLAREWTRVAKRLDSTAAAIRKTSNLP